MPPSRLVVAASAALLADAAFERALKADGFRHRWEWTRGAASAQSIAAYDAKVAADRELSRRFGSADVDETMDRIKASIEALLNAT